ncbi:hypothetical protein ACF1A3_35875, partial [Streptomyces globisporus]
MEYVEIKNAQSIASFESIVDALRWSANSVCVGGVAVEVGFPTTGRRRMPGLRREEVAALAGVGLTGYTWFEQGRDI